MDLIPQLLTQIAGGAGAAALDRAKPEWALQDVGGSGITITPGALAAAAGLALLVVMPKAGGTARAFLANLTGGALVVEGVKLAEEKILPMIEGNSAAPPQQLPAAAAVKGLPYGYARNPAMWTDWQVRSGLMQYRAA